MVVGGGVGAICSLLKVHTRYVGGEAGRDEAHGTRHGARRGEILPPNLNSRSVSPLFPGIGPRLRGSVSIIQARQSQIIQHIHTHETDLSSLPPPPINSPHGILTLSPAFAFAFPSAFALSPSHREKYSATRTSCIILTRYGPLSCTGNLLYNSSAFLEPL